MLPALATQIYWSLKLDYQYSTDFRLVVRDGAFSPSDLRNPICHPLETLLVNEPADPSQDQLALERRLIAEKLEVNQDWIDGFCDGYRGTVFKEHSDYEYCQGYRAGSSAELRKLVT